MKWLCVSIVFLAAVSETALSALAPLLSEDNLTATENEYIVVFKEEISYEQVAKHKSTVRQKLKEPSSIMHEYDIGSTEFRGYAATLTAKELNEIRSKSEVAYVEKSQILQISSDCVSQLDATWGIVRTTVHELQDDFSDYNYSLNGSGVDVYVIDTGIYMEHEEFKGRVVWGYDSVSDPSPRNDGNGHGTHITGTVLGSQYGVAKRATAIAVRVLNDNGAGSTAAIISGIDWTVKQHKPGKKSIANMALGGSASTVLDDAVDAAVKSGVHFTTVAGGSNTDACLMSPARSNYCVTVASTNKKDQRSSFSNYGSCVDIFAPGTDITAAWNDGGYRTISGTSMASAHVSGVMAKLLSERDYTPNEMKLELKKIATKDKIKDAGPLSPNLLVFNNCTNPVV